MTRRSIIKQTINVPRKNLINLMNIVEYQNQKLEYYTSNYGDVELFYGQWRKKDEKKN